MPSYLNSDNFFVYLVSENRQVFTRIQHWLDLDFGKSGWGDFGDGKLTFPVDAPWLAQLPAAFDPFDNFYGYTIDIYARGGTRWSGPVADAHLESVAGRAVITWDCETMLSNACRRRLDVTTVKAETVFNTNADNVILTVLRAAMNDTTFGGIVPSGYSPPSGSGARTDFHDWTIGVAALNSPAQSSVNVNFTAQDGNTVIAIVEYAAEHGDCFVTIAEVAAAAYSVGVESPYQSGISKDVVWSFGNGLLAAKSSSHRTSTIVNKPQIKGAGSGALQSASWGDDSSSRGTYGIHEGSLPEPGGSGATTSDTASKWASALAEPKETIELEVNEAPGSLWGTDWGQRTQIIWYDDASGASGTATIRGWRVKQAGRSPIKVSAIVGDVVMSEVQQMARFTPLKVMGGSPTLLRNRNG